MTQGRAVNWVLTVLTSPKTALRIALVFVGQFCLFRGIGYLPWFGPEMIPTGVQTITVFVPLWVFAFGWLAAGLLALISVITCKPEGSGGAILMSLIWAIGYTTSWIAAIDRLFIGHFPFYPLPYLWSWSLRIPFVALDTDGSPAARDYLAASQYWFAVGALACGYVLARFALGSRRGLGVRERT